MAQRSRQRSEGARRERGTDERGGSAEALPLGRRYRPQPRQERGLRVPRCVGVARSSITGTPIARQKRSVLLSVETVPHCDASGVASSTSRSGDVTSPRCVSGRSRIHVASHGPGLPGIRMDTFRWRDARPAAPSRCAVARCRTAPVRVAISRSRRAAERSVVRSERAERASLPQELALRRRA